MYRYYFIFFINPLVPSIALDSLHEICNGQAVLLDATTNCTTCTYSWSPNQNIGSPNSSNTYVFPNQSTVYTITVTTSSGCSNQDSVLVEIIPTPAVPTISQTFNGLVCDSLANNYQWYFNGTLIPGATNNYYNTFVSGNYTVVVSNLQKLHKHICQLSIHLCGFNCRNSASSICSIPQSSQ